MACELCDLLTLLLCFFISVFALYQPNESNGSSSAITSTRYRRDDSRDGWHRYCKE
jgi:hypothetical protein